MGKIENSCLEVVRKHLDGGSCHGLSNDEFQKIRNLILDVNPTDTPHKTAFPDFISYMGFIEHFAVSSGECYQNGGYKNQASKSKLIKRQKDFMDSISQQANKTGQITIASKLHAFERWHESLGSFENVFITHWQDHIESLHQYGGIKHISCFMIESDDIIAVHESPLDAQKLCYGDLVSERKHFSLAYDIRLLDFIYGYKDEIDYVIYVNEYGYVEVIKTSNIPFLKDFLHHHTFALAACGGIQTAYTYGMVYPNNSKGDENNG